MKPAKKGTQKSPKSTTPTGRKPTGFTDEERVAMRERLQEPKADAKLDEGHMRPTAFALLELTAAEEAKIGALVKKAVSED